LDLYFFGPNGLDLAIFQERSVVRRVPFVAKIKARKKVAQANSLSGLRYERDMTALASGAQLGFMLSNTQNIINGLPKTEVLNNSLAGARNSPNTNSAEHTAAKSFYRLVVAPTLAAGLSMAPTSGPVGATVRAGALFYGTSNSAATSFADTLVGPKGEQTN
jgi:hypothetical protein